MSNNADDIRKKHEDEDRRSAMQKKMAEEEKKRADLKVEHWDGMQSHGMYLFSNENWKWRNLGKGARVFVVLLFVIGIALISLLVFLTVRGIVWHNKYNFLQYMYDI